MDVPSAKTASPSAAFEYAEQLQNLNALQLADQRRDRICGIAKLAVAACALVTAALAIQHPRALALLLASVAAFVGLVVAHERVLGRMRSRTRTIQFYEDGVARLNGQWMGRGPTGERCLDGSHVYARDLDIFGTASVFLYLCTARTRSGEDRLASWLLVPAGVDEILARQLAVRDISNRLRFREQLASAGETVRTGVHPEAISAWGERQPILASKATRVLTTTLAALWLAGILAWIVTGSPYPALLISVLNFAYAHHLHPRLERSAAEIEKAAKDLRLLADVLALMEREKFTAPLLLELQSSLNREGQQPSAAIRRLARLSESIQSRHSLFARPFDLVTFWSAQLVFVAERWQREFGPALRPWIDAVGTMEAIASLSTFSYEHPEYAFPEFVAKGPLFEAEGLAHPLLSSAATVQNDVALGPGRQLMILSGPNMAGKSTFIRSIGVNAVLAQCGAPVRARHLRLSPLRVAASICILDSLSGGISRFYAEIRRIKAIADLAEEAVPVLFLLDELLSGTNSHDRFVGTEFVLQLLVERSAIGIVSTHDLALAQIPDSMQGRAFNTHFEDRFEDGKLIFDYKIKPGVVQTSNALKLMRAIGLGVSEK
jgi:MutS domain V